ncbi:hypothetical protein BDN70DRAFT_875969 [Pholiota conissans]|uniref:Uncharacterized protein n=1 Tax=Pholiota conissans TaxID=109636 RepID=A0A9P5Z618_9AGAR|nr:hypothetical protein BDN70DRAFT_875969 [Pholiota conissans]
MQNANEVKNEPELPVGETPFWEEESSEEEDGKQLKSVAESFVLPRSLKQSRDRWLYHTFPKFSSKTRGNKAPEITQPAHTIQARGRCTMTVGPLDFPDTILYEVNYLASQVPPSSGAQSPSSNPYWQSTVGYQPTYSYTPSTLSTPVPTVPTPTVATTAAPSPASTPAIATSSANTPSVPVPELERVPTPLISSLTPGPVSTITPSLISQVNAAAAANPILANLLQLAAAGDATQDQLKTLGLLIQSLAAMDSAATTAQAAAVAPQQQPYQPTTPHANYYPTNAHLPVKPFDLVIEFRETPGDRWLFPRGTVYAERKLDASTSNKNADIRLITCLSNDGKMAVQLTDQIVEDSVGGNSGLYTTSLVLKEAPLSIWDTIFRWIGGPEKNDVNKKHLDNLVQPKRFYPALRLSAGPTLTQLQNASAPTYTMKLLRHGPTQQRAPRARKPYEPRKNAASKSAVSTEVIAAKKSRASQPKPPATIIQCTSCKQTDVPLIMGGRFCRPCVETGKHNIIIASQTPASQTPALLTADAPKTAPSS